MKAPVVIGAGARRAGVGLALAAGLAVLTLMLARDVAGRDAPCRTALIPAYVPPAELDRVAARASAGDLIILNPDSGPDARPHAGFRRAVEHAQRRGARVLGYVATDYGRRPRSAVRAEIERYAAWYGVDGIFLDEVSSDRGRAAHYATLSGDARRGTRGIVVLNPGRVPASEYFENGDIVVTFEGPADRYARAVEDMPAWLSEVPPGQVAHLVYAASADAASRAADLGARAGHFYATSGVLPNPWRVVPGYDGAPPPCGPGPANTNTERRA